LPAPESWLFIGGNFTTEVGVKPILRSCRAWLGIVVGEANLGGTSPTPPARGLAPPGPPFPTPVGLGFASVLGLTRGGVARVGNSPLILMFLGAHPPNPLGGGTAPSTPFPHPRRLRVCQRFGPHSWRGCKGGQLAPYFNVLGGTSPTPPARGLAPPGPPFPTPVGLGFASVLGPTRGEVARVGNSPLILMFLGAHPPHPLGGGTAPSTPFPHPRRLRVCQRFGPHSWPGC